jgi:ADP-ribosyl-[dinitrogen reductase] hydrolase
MKDAASCFDTYGQSLEDDLKVIRDWGATALVSLIDFYEMKMLGVEDLPEKTIAAGLLWLHLPIGNLGVPDEQFERKWQERIPLLRRMLGEGQRIVLHCREGNGRTGIVAARLLIETGMEASQAIRSVMKVRPGSFFLPAHEAYCLAISPAG